MAGCQMIPFPKTENNDMPANILNLDAYNITGIQENETDTGGQVEKTKALERTLVKELGKIVP